MFGLANLVGTPPARPPWGLPAPDSLILLEIFGAVCWPNAGDTVQLDAPLLHGFETRTLVTSTDFQGQTGPQIFRGVPLMDILRAAGWRGTDITLHGADGYRMQTNLTQLRAADGMIATSLNNLPMQCTRHAPLWLVFSYDTAPDRLTRRCLTNLSVRRLTGIEIS